MEHGATWLRREGPEEVAGEPEGQSSMARRHPPCPSPGAGTSPPVAPGVCYSPKVFFIRKQFFSKYLGETLFAVSVWGLQDRI